MLQEVPVELGQWANPGTVLAKVVRPDQLKAELRIPEVRARDVRMGQRARIDLRTTEVEGTVIRIDPAVTDGNVIVDVELEGELPPGARPDLTVDGSIELERLDDVVSITKPANIEAGGVAGLFVLTDHDVARRTRVEFGRASVSAIEIKSGLKPGDRVIVSDVTQWQANDEIRIEGDQ